MAGPVAGGGGEQLRRFRRLADLTAVVTFLLIVVGGIVRVSESGLGCGPGGSGTKGWPLCGGQVIPLVGNENRMIEFSHRFLATVVVILIGLLCYRAYRDLSERNGWAFRGSRDRRRPGAGPGRPRRARPSSTASPRSWWRPTSGPRWLLGTGALARRQGALGVERRIGRPGDGAGPRAEALRGDGCGAASLRDRRRRATWREPRRRASATSGPTSPERTSACGKMFPECGSGKFLPFGNNRLTDIHLTHRVFVYTATIAIIVAAAGRLRARIARQAACPGGRAPASASSCWAPSTSGSASTGR